MNAIHREANERSKDSPELQNRTSHRVPVWLEAPAVFGIVLVALALRLYRIDEQSIWMDDFLGAMGRHAPNLTTALDTLTVWHPLQGITPVHYILQYLWGQCVGTSLTALRILSVLVGTTSIPLIYLLGRLVYGRFTGLVAAICLAMSPQHVWYAQEVRPYTLLVLLVLVSLYALLRAFHTNKLRWWIMNWTANALLLWSNLLTGLVLFVEGLFLLSHVRRHKSKILAWGGAHCLLCLVWSAWLLFNLPYVDNYQGGASLTQTLQEIFADDVVAYHCDLLPPWKSAPRENPSPLAQCLLPVRPVMDNVLLTLVLAALTWLAASCFRFRRSPPKEGVFPQDATDIRREGVVLFLLLFFVPAGLLNGLDMLFRRPLLGPMYTMYCTIGLYMAIGVLLASLPGKKVRWFSAAILVILYAYQLLLLLPETTRSDWIQTARILGAESSDKDLLLDLAIIEPRKYVCEYLPNDALNLEVVRTFQAACDRAAAFYENASYETPAKAGAWIVFTSLLFDRAFPRFNAMETLDAGLASRGLVAQWRTLPGHYNIHLGRIGPEPGGATPRATHEPVDSLVPIDYVALAKELRLNEFYGETNAIMLLREYITLWPPIGDFMFFYRAVSCLGEGEATLAECLLRYLDRKRPGFCLAEFGLGLTAAARNDPTASGYFDAAFQRHRPLKRMMCPYVQALLEGGSYEACQTEILMLQTCGFDMFTDALVEVAARRFGVVREPPPWRQNEPWARQEDFVPGVTSAARQQ